LVEGVLAGLGGIAVFIPQIAILFGFITVMEETGYMSRVSFLMDRIMRKFGLNGKSVVPLMSGFACAIPAIMATRNIENWKERLTTILITPFMSCSARIPVYTILIGLVIPDETVFGLFNLKGITFMALYLFGIVAAILTAIVLSFTLRIKEESFFIMELPVYQPPRWKNVILTMYEKAKIFTLEAGKVILIISVILWFLASFGPGDDMDIIAARYDVKRPSETVTMEDIQAAKQSEMITASYAGVIGRYIEPVIEPLGFDWKIGIALVTSFAAREVFVGTMATIYSVGASDNEFHSVREHMVAEINPKTGQPFYTLAVGLSLMIFYAFAMQCMSTLAVVKRETRSWKWPAVQLVYMTGLAYLASMVVFQLLR
jgi:ferrous iron transport protein B